jgi:hypothetical protein
MLKLLVSFLGAEVNYDSLLTVLRPACLNLVESVIRKWSSWTTKKFQRSVDGAARYLNGRCQEIFDSVFFIKHHLLVPLDTPRKDFEFFRIFEELFEFVINSRCIQRSVDGAARYLNGRCQEIFDSVVFIKHNLLVPLDTPRRDFKFFRIFEELFEFVINSRCIHY